MSFDFSDPDEPPKRKRRSSAALTAWGIVAFLAVGTGAAGWYFTRSIDSPRKDADYLTFLLLCYEQKATSDASVAWLEVARRADWRDSKVFQPVIDEADFQGESLERQIVAVRKQFIKEHGMEPMEWAKRFDERFPERRVIFDEIRGPVRRVCQEQAIEESRIATNLIPGRPEEEWRQMRVAYFRKNASMFVARARQETLAMESIANLRRKVEKSRSKMGR